MTIPMTATKNLTYAGKRVATGDDFDAKTKGDARLLAAIGKAKYRTAAVSDASVQKAAAATDNLPAPGDILAPLREEYQRVIGRKPYHGWDAETLREKIDAHTAAPAADAE